MSAAPSKGETRRRSIVEAAAAIILAEGVRAVTHRTVAERARCSLSATTYYFSGLEDLLGAAGELLAGRWAEQAERVRDTVRAGLATTSRTTTPKPTTPPAPQPVPSPHPVLDALLPPAGEVRGHYDQLVSAGAAPAVAQAYHAGRRRLDAAVADILRTLGSTCPADLAIAVVDGAVVSALSEGRDVRKTAADLLARVM